MKILPWHEEQSKRRWLVRRQVGVISVAHHGTSVSVPWFPVLYEVESVRHLVS